MEKYRRGTIIRLMRNALNITQEELIIDDNGEEICSLKTLSNVENGKQKLGKEAYGRIMNKLGSAIRKSDLLLATSEIKVFEKKKELHRMLRNQEYESAKILLEEIKDDLDMESPFNRQYYLCKIGLILYMKKEIKDEQYLNMLFTALKLSIKYFNSIDMDKWPYTIIEAELIMDIAIVYADMGRTQECIDILYKLRKALLQGYLDEKSLSKIIIVISDNIANLLGNKGDNKLAIEIDRETIEFSKRSNNFGKISSILYDIYWNENEIIRKSSNTTFNNKQKKSYLKKIYYIAISMNDTSNIMFLRDKMI